MKQTAIEELEQHIVEMARRSPRVRAELETIQQTPGHSVDQTPGTTSVNEAYPHRPMPGSAAVPQPPGSKRDPRGN